MVFLIPPWDCGDIRIDNGCFCLNFPALSFGGGAGGVGGLGDGAKDGCNGHLTAVLIAGNIGRLFTAVVITVSWVCVS